MSSRTGSIILSGLVTVILLCPLYQHALAAGKSVVGPYEVIVYEAADYLGKSKSWKLDLNTHRIRAISNVGDMSGKISSIHVGSKVNAILYMPNIYYKLGKPDLHMYQYNESSPLIHDNDWPEALIILPKDFKGAWGMSFSYVNPYSLIRDSVFGKVIPIPELKSEKIHAVKSIRSFNDKVSDVEIFGTSNENIKVTLYEHANFGGRRLTLPGPGSSLMKFHLKTYQFNGIMSSIKVEYTGADTVTPFPMSAHEAVPIKPQPKMAPADPGLAGKLPQSAITPGKLTQVEFADIAGQWVNRRGIAYDIDQKGNTFHWFAPELNENADGTINGNNLSVSWKAPKGGGSTTGKVTKTSPEGMALTIEWDNGARFTRK